jgi:hypothetical protein
MPPSPFSKRYGYTGQPKEITIREDAPENLRCFVLQIAVDSHLSPSCIREITSAILELRPDSSNWSGPYIWEEAERHIYGCEWFKVYDIIERIWKYLKTSVGGSSAAAFEEAINDFFVEKGIGWQLVKGEIITRGRKCLKRS